MRKCTESKGIKIDNLMQLVSCNKGGSSWKYFYFVYFSPTGYVTDYAELYYSHVHHSLFYRNPTWCMKKCVRSFGTQPITDSVNYTEEALRLSQSAINVIIQQVKIVKMS